MQPKLAGKVAIVTGGSRGIGAAIALRLAQEGADIIINYRTQSDQAEDIVKRIVETTEQKAIAVQGNVAIAGDVSRLVEITLDSFGKIDILCANAGIVGPLKPLSETTTEEWNAVVDTNLTGVFLCNRAVISHMMEQKSGRIINTSSIFGKKGWANYAPYAASKAGVIMLTQSLANELAAYNITVNAICPGMTRTDLVDHETKYWAKEYKMSYEEMTAEWLKYIPMARIQSPEEQAHIVAWLASDEASYITGVAISCAGGMEMN
jgi:3-oxoacyl-[acyl-carrier protein] reductase